MSKVSKFIGRALHFLDVQIGDTSRKVEAIKLLRDTLGLDKSEAVKIYRLWYFNKGHDDYYNVEEESESTLLEFIKTISEMSAGEIDSYTDDLYDIGMLDKILGPYFNGNCGGWNSSTPCISFKRDGIQLELDRDGWENYFSGLGDDDLWVYYNAHSSYRDHYEDVDSEEFNYVYTNEETIEHLKTLAILAGKDDWPGKDGEIEDDEVNDFLSEILPHENYESIVDDYLGEFSVALTNARENSARYCYEHEVKYNTNGTRCESGDYCIFIPYDDLIGFINVDNLITLSELKDIEINGEIYLSDCWYDAWVDNEGVDDSISELNRSLKNTIEKLSEDVDLEELIRQRTEMVNMLDKMGFLKYTKTSKGDYYKSKDGKIDLHTNNINYKDKKIKFSYEGKQHLIPIEEFPNWVYGSPLDLNESVRVDKKLLKERTENINKISIFDFDGTLMDTPDSKEGKKQWEEFKGEEYPHIGWWSKPESLDDSVFDIQPIESTVSDYKNEMNNPNTFVIMLTGRLPHQSKQIEELLALHNIHFKEYHYKSNGDTLTSKINTIKSLLNRFPEVNEIEMWEDREPHAIAFDEWGKENGVNIKVNIVKKNDISINESVGERNELMYKKVVSQLEPPYIYNLTSMTFSFSEAEKILSMIFGKRVYIKDNSEFVSSLSVSDPDMFEVEDAEGKLLYFEDHQYPTNITW